VTARHLRPERAILVFYTGHSGDPDYTRQIIPELVRGYAWDNIHFMNINLEVKVQNLEAKLQHHGVFNEAVERMRLQWEQRNEIRAWLDREGILAQTRAVASSELTLCYNTLIHFYINHMLGLFPRARRVVFPHAINGLTALAPETYKDVLSPRSVRTWIATVSTFKVRRVLFSFLLKGMFRLGLNGTFIHPFSGSDAAYSLSGVTAKVPTTRLAAADLQCILAAAAESDLVRDSLAKLQRELPTNEFCIFCLSEYEEKNHWFPHDAHVQAVVKLMRKCAATLNVKTFLVKPHPRTAWQNYEAILKEIHATVPDFTLLEWPRDLAGFPIEVVLTRLNCRYTASLASCAASPWACPRVVNLLSTEIWRELVALATEEGFSLKGIAEEIVMTGSAVNIDTYSSPR
jgi:hypothetical protein